MSDKIKVLIVEPNKEAKLEEIDCNLKSFQKIVDGHIQDVFIDENTILVCNEEGKLCGLQPNRVFRNDVICGTFFIAGNDGGDELVSLSDEQVKQYTEMFNMGIESQSHESQDLQERFLDSLNRIFADIELDLHTLNESYNTEDKQYAKDVLKVMHKAFADTYGTTCIDELDDQECEFIFAPAVLRSNRTGDLCIGLVCMDTQSSGEHWDTVFMMSHGIVFQSEPVANEKVLQEIKAFVPYNYWYTPTFRGDIHVDKRNMPDDVKAMIDYAVKDDQAQSMNMDDTQEGMQMGGLE